MALIAGCAGARAPGSGDDDDTTTPPTCGGELPAYAAADAGTLRAVCGDLEVARGRSRTARSS